MASLRRPGWRRGGNARRGAGPWGSRGSAPARPPRPDPATTARTSSVTPSPIRSTSSSGTDCRSTVSTVSGSVVGLSWRGSGPRRDGHGCRRRTARRPAPGTATLRRASSAKPAAAPTRTAWPGRHARRRPPGPADRPVVADRRSGRAARDRRPVVTPGRAAWGRDDEDPSHRESDVGEARPGQGAALIGMVLEHSGPSRAVILPAPQSAFSHTGRPRRRSAPGSTERQDAVAQAAAAGVGAGSASSPGISCDQARVVDGGVDAGVARRPRAGLGRGGRPRRGGPRWSPRSPCSRSRRRAARSARRSPGDGVADIEERQASDEDRGLQRVEPAVATTAGARPGSARPSRTDAAGALGGAGSVKRRAAVADGAEVLGRIEAVRRRVPGRADVPAVDAKAVRLRAVLDQGEPAGADATASRSASGTASPCRWVTTSASTPGASICRRNLDRRPQRRGSTSITPGSRPASRAAVAAYPPSTAADQDPRAGGEPEAANARTSARCRCPLRRPAGGPA